MLCIDHMASTSAQLKQPWWHFWGHPAVSLSALSSLAPRPLAPLHLTTLPKGPTNSVQILQGDISFIIQEEMPNIAAAFMDDVNIRGAPTCYETNISGWYASTTFADPPPQSTPVPCTLSSNSQHFEVIPKNSGNCQFTWEHLNNIN